MELAGLEPATSWVRFALDPSPALSILRAWLNHARVVASCFAVVRHRLSPFDHRLTTREGRCPPPRGRRSSRLDSAAPLYPSCGRGSEILFMKMFRTIARYALLGALTLAFPATAFAWSGDRVAIPLPHAPGPMTYDQGWLRQYGPSDASTILVLVAGSPSGQST